MSVSELQLARPDTPPELRFNYLWWAIGWAVVLYITVSCLEPAKYVPNLHLWDKAEHALAFFGMSLWFGGLIHRSRYPLVAVAMMALGGGIEIAQGAMNLGRDEDIMDFVADSVGIVVAMGLLYLGLGNWARWIEGLFWRTRERP